MILYLEIALSQLKIWILNFFSNVYQNSENDEQKVDNHSALSCRKIDLRNRDKFSGIRIPDESSGKTGISGQSGCRVDDD